jgi:integrase
MVKTSGLPALSFHALRHAAASTMLSAGIPLKVASERLGHSSVSITADLYQHVLPDTAREAADQIGEVFRIAASQVAGDDAG